MTVVPIGPKYCEKTRKYLDFYIDNELMTETNHEMFKHLEGCRECSQAMQDRLLIRNRLREAVNREPIPRTLQERLQKTIRQGNHAHRPPQSWSRWSLGAAAMFVLCLGGLGTLHLWRLSRDTGGSSQANLPQFITEQTAALLKIGVGDHVHCVIEHHDDKELSTSEQMAKELGVDYYGLVTLVNDKLPNGFSVSVAHQCDVNGRRFVHLIFKNQEKVLSLVITKKGSDGFPIQDRVAGLNSAGPALHRARLDGFEAVGFETKTHLAFVVSSLEKDENLQIAADLAPSVNSFLANLEI
jgi:anti-sigma factor RsiW